MARTVGIGIQSYCDIIKKGCFYVDKTSFIREWWESEDSVTLITRPRRFGKTLTMSMVEQFFSVEYAGRGDLFEGLPSRSRYDVIVSNPPYIASGVIDGLQREVREYEPRMALDGQEDGLYFYRRLAAEAPGWLRAGGRLYLEIGYDQGAAVQRLLVSAGFEEVGIRKDLAGLDRVVRGVYRDV